MRTPPRYHSLPPPTASPVPTRASCVTGHTRSTGPAAIALLVGGGQLRQLGLQLLLARLVRQLGLLPGLLVGGRLALLPLLHRVGADGCVHRGVQLLQPLGLQPGLDVAREVALVLLRLLLLQRLHVLRHMASQDVLAQDLGVQLLGLTRVADEALVGVGHVQAAVQGALQRGKDLGPGAGALEARVQQRDEGAWALVRGVHVVVLAHIPCVALIRLIQPKLGQHAAGQQEARGVGGRVVGQARGQAVGGQLVGVGGGDHDVAGQRGVRDLADDVGVGEAHDKPGREWGRGGQRVIWAGVEGRGVLGQQGGRLTHPLIPGDRVGQPSSHRPVLGGVVLVLVLGGQPQAGAVVGLSLTPPAVLDLREGAAGWHAGPRVDSPREDPARDTAAQAAACGRAASRWQRPRYS
ncbi:hypothetical protein F751_4742 [Auxenochlorella protothecoides]|uniref:Uncharacterized protein n=1 Tax=Auxenochlorella protothecoides TaxID=3075 RepID=A0A087SKJ5_AUXPR|nr:hypothetical protein F751_4742 [Auxenochlorella protothecoides]KFM26249.1 hypothetical protein F751_4742 [Auxenochlorella protothecoides]